METRGKEMVESKLEFRSGLTWRSILALLYSLFVFTPAVIWLNLSVVGVGLGGSIPIITLLIFVEIAALYNRPLTVQEAAIIFGPATVAGSAGFLNLIYRAYFVHHPLLHVFNLDPFLVPKWYAPPPASLVLDLRTFYNLDWILPVSVLVASHFLGMAGAIFFGLLGRELFIEGERLQFPIQQITVATIDVLATRTEDRMMIFAWSGLISFFYGLVLYTVPTCSSVVRVPIRLLPTPWVDFTYSLEPYLPGGAFGIATDLVILSTGFIIPKPVVLGMFIGSITVFLVANPLLVRYGISDWSSYWVRGMDLTQIWQYSNLYFWLSPLIGIGFAVGIVPIISRWRLFIRSLRSAFKLKLGSSELSERVSGSPFPVVGMIILFLAGCVGAIILDLILISDFPFWPLILYEIVLPFVLLLASGRMMGTAGVQLEIPYLRQLIILSSGYPKVDVWFLPLSLNPGVGWTSSFKICQLTNTDTMSWIKAHLIAYPLSLVAGFIYMSIFWQIAPIPSDLYPSPGIEWPISIMNQCVWITKPARFFQPETILASFLISGAIISVFQIIKIPFSAVGLAAGFSSPIPTVMTMFIGMITGVLIAKMKGRKWFDKYRATIAAGIGIGEGIAIVIGVAFALATKSVWTGRF